MNWLPFFLHFDRTSLASISNFNQSALVFFPLGFLLPSIYPTRSVLILVSAIVSAAIALPLEISQGWVIGRYPSITDAIGAIAGALLGSWISWHYEDRRRSTTEPSLKPRLTEDSQSPSLRQSSSGDLA